jgi:phosphatidylglycerol:prolipoprotein diacylglycerol transferase
MDQLLSITWDLGRGIPLGFFTLRFYSLLFALGFVLGYFYMKRIFKSEGIAIEKLDTLLTYVVVATIVGARLGHVFFYQWDYYSSHPGEILKVWEGGLASHGAVISIIIALIIYSKKVLNKSPLWILDRVVITVALAACFIRLGNYANSEIYGDVSNSAWETVFTNPVRERIMASYGDFVSEVEFLELEEYEITPELTYPLYDIKIRFSDKVDSQEKAAQIVFKNIKPRLDASAKEDLNMVITGSALEWDESGQYAMVEARGYPRSPTQLYEAIAYLLIFFVLARLYLIADVRQRQGLLFGLFLVLLFGFRFVIEFMKENQVSAEQDLSFNIGQMLSIPAVAVGLYFSIFSKKGNNEK